MTYCGSWKYSAPEILLQEEYDPPAVDVWSLGVMLFQMVAGRLPFSEVNESESLTKVSGLVNKVSAKIYFGYFYLTLAYL